MITYEYVYIYIYDPLHCTSCACPLIFCVQEPVLGMCIIDWWHAEVQPSVIPQMSQTGCGEDGIFELHPRRSVGGGWGWWWRDLDIGYGDIVHVSSFLSQLCQWSTSLHQLCMPFHFLRARARVGHVHHRLVACRSPTICHTANVSNRMWWRWYIRTPSLIPYWRNWPEKPLCCQTKLWGTVAHASSTKHHWGLFQTKWCGV